MKTCPKCNFEMEHGFQVDGIDRKSYRQAQWAAGPPKAHDETFLGLKVFEEWALKLKEEDLKSITTYRCVECGFLENYAH
jgi:hypothetical protein